MKKIMGALGFCVAAGLASGWVPQPGSAWPDGSVSVASDLETTAPNNTVAWTSAANEAIASWNALLERVKLTSTAPSGQPWYDNGRNELFFDRQVYGQSFPRGVVAVTVVTTDRDERVEADIVFNAEVPWAVYNGAPRPNSMDFRRVAVHELGHVLGLDHPDEAGQKVSAIMNSVAGDAEVPLADDQAGIRALYDRAATTPPIILGGPTASRSEVFEGFPMRFTVVVGGRGPFAYAWRRGDVAVANGTGSVLRLDTPVARDAGDYTVVVRNRDGATTSRSEHLSVVVATRPPSTSNSPPPRDIALTAGSDTILQAVLTRDAPMRFEWKHNGAVVGVTTDPGFTLHDLQFSDSGDYTVTATNSAGSATASVVHLSVTPGMPPQFTSDFGPTTFELGAAATLSAFANALPFPTYEWSKDGRSIASNGGSLTMFPFQASDAGSYTVTASNAFGRITSPPIVVSVAGADRAGMIIRPPTATTVYAGTPIEFGVTTEGDHLSYRWFKGGAVLRGAEFSTLTFSGVQPADAGVYSVEIANGGGSATSQGARLTVLPAQKPLITRQPSAQTVPVRGTLDISVGVLPPYGQAQPPLNYGYFYQWFKDGVPIDAFSSSLFRTASLADSGRYFVRVTSPSGLATDSDAVEVVVTTGAVPIVASQPGNLLIDAGDSEALRLSAVALIVLARNAAPGADATLQLVAASAPPQGGVTPGTYVVRATKNGVTETSKPFTVGFVPAVVPVLFTHPRGRVADLGENFDLLVNATAYAPLTYQWSKDGVAIVGATTGSYSFKNFSASQAGAYRVSVTSAAGTSVSEPAQIESRGIGPPTIVSQPRSQTILEGSLIDLSVSAIGGALHYQWLKDGLPIAGATSERPFVPSTPAATGAYSVVVSNGGASIVSRAVTVRVLTRQRAPEILFPPESQTAPLGGDVGLVVGADGAPLPDRYQWRKNGVDIPGATDAKLRLYNVQPSDAGTYTVVAFNANGSAVSAPAALTIDAAGRLVNLATRAQVGSGANTLIAGFVLAGTQSRSVLVRAVGDQLAEFGVSGVLRNPLLRVFDAQQKQITVSDDWFAGDEYDGDRRARIAALQAAEKAVGAFALREDTRDGALIVTLAPGSYTAQMSGVAGTTGVGLVEIYELGSPSTTHLANLSSRSFVGTGAQILIPGVVISGQAARRLLIRAVGPALAALGVTEALADPMLRVFDREAHVVAENNNWSESADPAAIVRAAIATGAFPLASGSKDAAVLMDFAPGAYTVQVTGVAGTTGVALVEVYVVTN